MQVTEEEEAQPSAAAHASEESSSEDDECMILKIEAEKAKAEAEKMIERDNLRIKTMAKYKALKADQLQAFLNIE